MIVLKATQEKLLSVLQSVAGIVEKRHTLPLLANILLRKVRGTIDLGMGAEISLVTIGCPPDGPRESRGPVVKLSSRPAGHRGMRGVLAPEIGDRSIEDWGDRYRCCR